MIASVSGLCILFIFNAILDSPHFDFEGGTLVLIAPVPGHCLPFTLFINFRFVDDIVYAEKDEKADGNVTSMYASCITYKMEIGLIL